MRGETPGHDLDLRAAVKAVIVGRMALITLVASMAAAFSDGPSGLAQHGPFAFLVALSAGLAVAYYRAARGGAEVQPLLATQFFVDVAIISYLLLFTGGASSPFAPLFLLGPLLGGVFLTVRGGLVFAVVSASAYTLIYAADRGGLLAPAVSGITERLSDGALRLRVALYVPLLLLVGIIGGAIGRRLREGARALNEAQAELHRALFDTESILENMSSGLASVDALGIVRHWNRAATEIVGLPAEAVRGRHYREAFGPGLESFAEQLHETLESGAAVSRHEAHVTRGDGRAVPLGLSTSLLRDIYGERRGVIAVFQDLSEVRELEARVRHQETLAAIGELSAGIAHEIRNCLNPIAGSVEVLQRELKVSGENARLLELIVRESERLDSFIRELLDYARERPLQPEAVEIGSLVRDVVDVARRHPSAAPGKTVRLVLGDEAYWARVDYEQMKQVLLNLVINGLEAIDGAGQVAVRAIGDGAAGRGGRVGFEVKDDGVGIPAEELERVTEPFFSTKNGGTGLGLAIVNRIVERHGGSLDIESRVGEGTAFRVWLPRATTPAGALVQAA
ncbi:MAG TPA: ATP-binding protein [Candidatus Eisenbacteria bacterium]|nr:ATP-binding protein [Candidatus Eisenbacteria bacterium]